MPTKLNLPPKKPEWMDERDWQALLGRAEGLTYGEIGDVLGLKLTSAHGRVKRALQALELGHYPPYRQVKSSKPRAKKAKAATPPEVKPERKFVPQKVKPPQSKHKVEYLSDGTLYWFYLDGKLVESGRQDAHHTYRLDLMNGVARALGTTVTVREVPTHDELLKAYVDTIMGGKESGQP